jgi:hypothetical protein
VTDTTRTDKPGEKGKIRGHVRAVALRGKADAAGGEDGCTKREGAGGTHVCSGKKISSIY